MKLLEWFTPGRWLLVGALFAALLLGAWRIYAAIDQGGFDRSEAIWKDAIKTQKIEAGRVLAEETAKVAKTEKALNDFKHNQELQDAKNQNTVAGLERRLVTLAGPAGRLRDPNAAGCGRGGAGATGQAGADAADSTADGTDDARLLSKELSGLLLADTKKADAINNAYISCRAQAFDDREQLK